MRYQSENFYLMITFRISKETILFKMKSIY